MVPVIKRQSSLHGLTQLQLEIASLGSARHASTLSAPSAWSHGEADFVPDAARVLASVDLPSADDVAVDLSFEKAGPRRSIYFAPGRTRVGIVTCGGLCPGTNSVVRSVVLALYHGYGVREIFGFRYGYAGLAAAHAVTPTVLTPELVRDIHLDGGSMLGTGRGSPEPAEMVSRLHDLEIDVLITIGGDGTLRGAHAIALEIKRRGLAIAVVGVPKTIDNDIPFVDQTFGFDTAVQIAAEALRAAHTEATSARDGVAVVKLMGREAGFLCSQATLASLDVNFCLVPEVPFDMDALLVALEARVRERGHALIAVAEGCGSSLAPAHAERDASGNLRFGSRELDIGPPLCARIVEHFAARQLAVALKYIDPSYLVRSVPPNASDNRYCDLLARHAVHAAMSGKTDLAVGHWNGYYTHVPLGLLATQKKRLDPAGELWFSVVSTTGQPSLVRRRP